MVRTHTDSLRCHTAPNQPTTLNAEGKGTPMQQKRALKIHILLLCPRALLPQARTPTALKHRHSKGRPEAEGFLLVDNMQL